MVNSISLLIVKTNADLVVSAEDIHDGEDFELWSNIDKLFY